MTMLIGTALLAVTLAQAPQPRGAAPQTDETIAVQRGARLTVNNFAGAVIVHTWNKDVLHVTARHPSQTRVNIRQVPAGVALSASGTMGPAASVDYDIIAPAWMPLEIDGTYDVITVEGTQAEVSAESVRGDITIKGGTGFITARSIEGIVAVEGAKGKMILSSVNEHIEVTDAAGEITADAINGGVQLRRVTSKSVEVSTVNGTIAYEGTVADGGHYTFATHNGDLLLDIPERSNATVSVRTYNGSFHTLFAALQAPSRAEAQRGKRVTLTMGNGSADITLESFGGSIRIGPGVISRGQRR